MNDRLRDAEIDRLNAEVERLRDALIVLMKSAEAACDTIELEPALFQARKAIGFFGARNKP